MPFGQAKILQTRHQNHNLRDIYPRELSVADRTDSDRTRLCKLIRSRNRKGRFHCLITPHKSPNHDIFSWEEPPTRWVQKEHTSLSQRADDEQPRSPSGALQARGGVLHVLLSTAVRPEQEPDLGRRARRSCGRTAFAGARVLWGPARRAHRGHGVSAAWPAAQCGLYPFGGHGHHPCTVWLLENSSGVEHLSQRPP